MPPSLGRPSSEKGSHSSGFHTHPCPHPPHLNETQRLLSALRVRPGSRPPSICWFGASYSICVSPGRVCQTRYWSPNFRCGCTGGENHKEPVFSLEQELTHQGCHCSVSKRCPLGTAQPGQGLCEHGILPTGYKRELIPGSERSPGVGNGTPFQTSCLKKSQGQRTVAGYSPGGHKESDASAHTAHVSM